MIWKRQNKVKDAKWQTKVYDSRIKRGIVTNAQAKQYSVAVREWSITEQNEDIVNVESYWFREKES